MGSEKDKKKPKSGGGYKWGSALIWAGGQFAYNWFFTPEMHILPTVSAVVSAFLAGWTTSAFVGRFAKWGTNVWILLVLGVVFGVAVFSGAFSGLYAAIDWWKTKDVTIEWEKLRAFIFSMSVVPPAILGAMTGLYVKTKFPGGKK
jgi:hypothetical protein